MAHLEDLKSKREKLEEKEDEAYLKQRIDGDKPLEVYSFKKQDFIKVKKNKKPLHSLCKEKWGLDDSLLIKTNIEFGDRTYSGQVSKKHGKPTGYGRMVGIFIEEGFFNNNLMLNGFGRKVNLCLGITEIGHFVNGELDKN